MSPRVLLPALFFLLLTLSPLVRAQEPLPDNSQTEAAQQTFFEKHVRPLLATHCYECHAQKKQSGNLRLDHHSFLLKGGDTGPAIVPGDPESSLLIEAVRYDSYEMPPTGKLPNDQIAILTKWVAEGAWWPDEPPPTGAKPSDDFNLEARKQYWSFQPIRTHPLPPITRTDWPRAPLDHWILAGLENAGLTPAPQAEKHILLRRLYFDLTGLPPSPADVEAFLADDSPQAWPRVVDRLLASPAFGERWGRHWLDLVRFGETYGHEFDWDIPHAWRYRDYVIRAWNENLPFDDFLREHLAGDLLAQPRLNSVDGTNESLVATAVWHLHEEKHGPVDVRLAEAERHENQIDLFGKAFLGLTIACARCHDHKFDPITAADYYALAGFLKSSRRTTAPLDPHGVITRRAAEIARQQQEFSTQFAKAIQMTWSQIETDLRAALSARPAESADNRADRWRALLAQPESQEIDHPLFPLAALANQQLQGEALTAHLASATQQARNQSGSILFEDFTDASHWKRSGWAFHEPRLPVLPANETDFAWPKPDSLDSRRLATPLVGTLRSRDFTIEHPIIWLRIAGEKSRVRLVVDSYQMDVHSALLFQGLTQTIDTNGKWQWIKIAGDLKNHLGERAYLEFLDEADGWLAIDEIRFSNSDSPPSSAPAPWAAALTHADTANAQTLVTALAKTLKEDTSEIAPLLFAYNLIPETASLVEAQNTRGQITKLSQTLPAPQWTLAMEDGFGIDEQLFVRGNHLQTAGLVPRRFLEAIGTNDQSAITEGSGRLALAERMLARDNPLPARVIVNRLWQHLFGRGLVPSVDNFGLLGETPSHPELLDLLASDFRDSGWNLKQMIRGIVLSRAYQMSSTPHPDAVQRAKEHDPTNTLLYAQRIRRLEAESIRDAILASSGDLNPKIGGTSVPVYLNEFSQGRGRPQTSGPLNGDGRRGLYIKVQRNFLTPMLIAFDFPLPATAVGRRNSSNVPAQALILLNDPFVAEQASKWATMILFNPTLTPETRIDQLFITAYQRPPTPQEKTLTLQFLQTTDPQTWPTNPTPWTNLCHVLINAKEFIFIR